MVVCCGIIKVVVFDRWIVVWIYKLGNRMLFGFGKWVWIVIELVDLFMMILENFIVFFSFFSDWCELGIVRLMVKLFLLWSVICRFNVCLFDICMLM